MNTTFLSSILLFCLFFTVKAQNCNEVLQSSENNECYALREDCRNTPECSYDCRNNTNVTYEVDAERGIVISRFPLPPIQCCHSRYEVTLMINEQVQDESMCTDDVPIKDYVRHSMKGYRIETCENGNCTGKPPCGKFGEVVFSYVYTGCYKILIKAYTGTNSRASSYSCPEFIETNYSKLRIVDAEPSMTYNYRQAESLSEVFIDPNSTFERMIISFSGDIKEIEDNPCERDGVELACCLVEAHSKNSLCKPTSEIMGTTCNISKNNLLSGIQCNFFHVSPGNYCVRINIVDERCEYDTVWTVNKTSCRWSRQIALDDTPPDKPEINVLSSHTVAIVVSILGLALIVLIVVGLVLRRKATMLNRSPAESPEEVVRPMINGTKVLLLYPRDCPELMTVMESFRKVLEAQNIEVFDCHSSEEVLNGPLYWLQKVMAIPKIRTIIVNTQCAYLQQQAILGGCNISNYTVYKDPIFLDSIFMYGLKVIMEDISSDSYLKNFVIGFNGFSDDEKVISLPTSFRRYNVPEHLPKLFLDMNLEFIQESFQLYNSSEYIVLQSNVKNLVNFKSTNPHYLESILNLV